MCYHNPRTIYVYIANANELAVSLNQAYIIEFKECFNGSAKCTPTTNSSLFTYNDAERVAQKRIDKTIKYIETLTIEDYGYDGYLIEDKNNTNLEIDDIVNNTLKLLKREENE